MSTVLQMLLVVGGIGSLDFIDWLIDWLMDGWMDGCVKVQVYIQYIVIPVAYNTCTQYILQGPWVKWLRQLPREQKCWVTYNHSVYKLSWFLHGSGANNPGSTIQVSNKQYHCAHTRTTVRTYLRRVGNNNGITNSSKWRGTSRRYNNTRIDQHAQIQNDTTNIHRRIWYLRRMEIQVPGVHGTNGQCVTTITREHGQQ